MLLMKVMIPNLICLKSETQRLFQDTALFMLIMLIVFWYCSMSIN